MDLEEMQDMSVNLIKEKGIEVTGENSFKLMRLIQSAPSAKEEIVNSLMMLMYLANEYGMNIEDGFLNKIEVARGK